jgi:hypothetical protein
MQTNSDHDSWHRHNHENGRLRRFNNLASIFIAGDPAGVRAWGRRFQWIVRGREVFARGMRATPWKAGVSLLAGWPELNALEA